MTSTRAVPTLMSTLLPATLRRAAIVAALAAFAVGVSACGTTGPAGPSAPAIGASSFRSLGPTLAVSAQPSAEEIAAAGAAGYRTVVNFRPATEAGVIADEAAIVGASGMRYVSIPVNGYALDASQADALDVVLRDSASAPVLMHCKSGMRAKAVWTIWLAKHGGLTPDQAIAEGDRAGLSADAKAAVEKIVR